MQEEKKQQHPGLYESEFEHDACGIGCIADLNNRKSYQTIDDAIRMLENMEHRGGKGSEPETGDGAGILTQIPHDFFTYACTELGVYAPR